jgi:type II secretory pathway component GspD/PulD (secretin)
MRLAMRDASIDEVLQFISDSTGKTILVRLAQLGPVKITVLSDRALPRSECLDRIYEALASNGLAVIEDDEVVWVDLMASIRDSPRPPLAVAAGEDIEAVSTNGVIVSMVLPLRDARAPMVLEQISPFLPDSATVVFDAERNQLLVLSTSACAKKIRRLAAALDGVATVDESTRSDAWTRVPGTMAQGSRGQRRDIFRDPLTEEGIAAMSRPELAKALAGVAKARQRGDLNDDVRAQLKREFDALVGAINERRR